MIQIHTCIDFIIGFIQNVFSSLADFSTLKMEPILFSETFTQDLHGATSQKTAFFIVTAVKTSDFTQFLFI
jgi:hypothetical protein